MSSGVSPTAAVQEAGQFFTLPLLSAYRAFQRDSEIQARPIDGLEPIQGKQFGDALSWIINCFRLGLDPSDVRPGLKFVGCLYGAAPGIMFGSLDWRANAADGGGYIASDHFSFLKPAPSRAVTSRQVFISTEVFTHLGALLRQGSGGGDLGEVNKRVADDSDRGDDFEIAAEPGAIAPGGCSLH